MTTMNNYNCKYCQECLSDKDKLYEHIHNTSYCKQKHQTTRNRRRGRSRSRSRSRRPLPKTLPKALTTLNKLPVYSRIKTVVSPKMSASLCPAMFIFPIICFLGIGIVFSIAYIYPEEYSDRVLFISNIVNKTLSSGWESGGSILNSGWESGGSILNSGWESGGSILNSGWESGGSILNSGWESGGSILNSGWESGGSILNSGLESVMYIIHSRWENDIRRFKCIK
jgi:hypothetical protein